MKVYFSAVDAFNENVKLEAILEPLGWQCWQTRDAWRDWSRPGATLTASASSTVGRDGVERLWVRSRSCGLPRGRALTPVEVWERVYGLQGSDRTEEMILRSLPAHVRVM